MPSHDFSAHWNESLLPSASLFMFIFFHQLLVEPQKGMPAHLQGWILALPKECVIILVEGNPN